MNSRDLCSNYKKQLVFVLDKLLKCEIIESALPAAHIIRIGGGQRQIHLSLVL